MSFFDWLKAENAEPTGPLWLVGKLEKRRPWSIVGVFSSQEKALAHCTTPQHFLGPVTIDAKMDDRHWEGASFPLVDAMTAVVAKNVREVFGGIH